MCLAKKKREKKVVNVCCVCVCVCMGVYVFVCILCLTNCQIACAVAGEISGLYSVRARVESHIRVQKVHYVVYKPFPQESSLLCC